MYTDIGKILTPWHSHHSSMFKCVQLHSILAQRHSRALIVHSSAFSHIEYSLKGSHVHSVHIQAHYPMLTQRHSHALSACSSTFNRIHTCSKASCALIFIWQSVTECIQSRSDLPKGVYAHSSAFKCIQCSLKGIHAHSERVQLCSVAFIWVQSLSLLTQKAFTCTQACSVVATLTQRHSVPPDK